VTVRHDFDPSTSTLQSAEPAVLAVPDLDSAGASLAAGGVPASLVGALFDGLSADDREWVVQRINHYRALAAADQAPEGRF
jgi:hypothetical protein